MFSCEFCEISKNTFFKEHLRRLLLQVVVRQMQVSLVNLNGLFEAKSDKMDSYNDFLGQLLQLMEFISMYLKGSVSVKDNKIFYCCISQKKYFIPSNIARISKLIQWEVWKAGSCRITQISPLFKDLFYVTWVASQSIICPRQTL